MAALLSLAALHQLIEVKIGTLDVTQYMTGIYSPEDIRANFGELATFDELQAGHFIRTTQNKKLHVIGKEKF
jgi:hypothetical protein